MERKEAIRSAYRLTGGNNFYDGMITCSTLSGKAVCRLVWDMNKAENDACVSYIICIIYLILQGVGDGSQPLMSRFYGAVVNCCL